jgi:opacity protein-like surface antigen
MRPRPRHDSTIAPLRASLSAKVLVSIGTALALLGAIAGACMAEDSDRVRYYLHLRGQDTNPLTGVHDHVGLSLGANLGRYWGLELSGDVFERQVTLGGRTFGEYGMGAVVPQLRLRYPFLDDRLVPYVVGGIGVGLAEFNDRKAPAFTIPVKGGTSVFPVGTIGTGIEYYFADNLALGVEFKYLVGPEQTLTVDGVRQPQRVNSLLTTLGLRMLVPELRPPPPAEARDPVLTRLYVALRYGATTSINSAYSGIEVEPEPAAFFGAGTQFFGAGIGLNFGRYLGAEFWAEGYEARLTLKGVGSVKEVGVGHFIPYFRLRYPLWDGRLVPAVFGGIGLSSVKTNDTKAHGADIDVETSQFGLATGVGAGIEYFIASNVAMGVDVRYLTVRGHTIQINDGPKLDGHFDTVAVTFTIRTFLWTFGH